MAGALVNPGLRTMGARSNPDDPRSNPDGVRSNPDESCAATPKPVDNSIPPAFGVRNPYPTNNVVSDQPIFDHAFTLQFAQGIR